MGIPTSSPGVMWPRGFSLESLGTGRLYPNGPEFGLSNTSGGFGSSGTGRITGVGLSERGLAGLAGQELTRSVTADRVLTGTFSQESTRSANLFSTILGDRFRFELQRRSLGATSEAGLGSLIQPTSLPGVDAVLQDRATTPDSILRTGL